MYCDSLLFAVLLSLHVHLVTILMFIITCFYFSLKKKGDIIVATNKEKFKLNA